MTRLRTQDYNPRAAINRGAPLWVEALWYATKMCFFLSAFPWPSRLKVGILNAFGASVHPTVYIKPRVNIHLPWRLTVGAHSMIGEEVFILNFEKVTIGTQVCLSQRSFICTGSHDYKDPLFSYRNAPIKIGDGAWIGANCFIAPGVRVGSESVITAGSILSKDSPDGMICTGNPCLPTRARWS